MSMLSRGLRFPGLVAGLTLWGLAGCQTSPSPAPIPTARVPEAGVPADAEVYKVVAEESRLLILVYRGGAMARLGHNHVIASHHLEGDVFVTTDPLATRFDIRVPVNELAVDEPAMREVAGEEFPPGVPQSAREGTRKNLLSEALLDGVNHPMIRLRATDVRSAGDGYDVGVEITLRNQPHVVRVPVSLDRKDGALMARGEFVLRQSDLGLKPFSVAMGTLVVLDDMKIRFELSARGSGTVPIS